MSDRPRLDLGKADRCVCGHRDADHGPGGQCLVCGCNLPTIVDPTALKRGPGRQS